MDSSINDYHSAYLPTRATEKLLLCEEYELKYVSIRTAQ